MTANAEKPSIKEKIENGLGEDTAQLHLPEDDSASLSVRFRKRAL